MLLPPPNNHQLQQTPTKKCVKCLCIKNTNEFGILRKAIDNLNTWCKQCNRENARRAYAKNIEKNRLRNRISTRELAKTGVVKVRQRRWREANPEHWLQLQRAGRYKRRRLKVTPESVEYGTLVRADPCVYCNGIGGTIDHIHPVNNGGENNWDNLAGACRRCNAGKCDKSLLHYLLCRIDK